MTLGYVLYEDHNEMNPEIWYHQTYMVETLELIMPYNPGPVCFHPQQ